MKTLINKMKLVQHAKNSFAIVLIVLCGALFTGCKKDKSDPEPADNEFVYAGVKAGVSEAAQGLYQTSDDGNVIFVYFFLDNNHVVAFATVVPKGKTKLVAGEYNDDNENIVGFILDGDDDMEAIYEMSSVDVSVALSGSKYTVDVTGTLTGKKSITGNYSGEITVKQVKSASGKSSDLPEKIHMRMMDTFNRLK